MWVEPFFFFFFTNFVTDFMCCYSRIHCCFETVTESVCELIFPNQIELIDRVDDIYRNTTWNDDFKGYGVQIQQVCGYGFLLYIDHTYRSKIDMRSRSIFVTFQHHTSLLLSALPCTWCGLPRGSTSITLSFFIEFENTILWAATKSFCVCASHGVIEFVPQASGINGGPCLYMLWIPGFCHQTDMHSFASLCLSLSGPCSPLNE